MTGAAVVFLTVASIVALWVWTSKLDDKDLQLLETLALWGEQY